MIKVLLYNTDNDKECIIQLPAIPRKGDDIDISSLEDDFMQPINDEYEDSDNIMEVESVLFFPNSDTVSVFITSEWNKL
jgi:hypothetical protein